MNRKNSIAAAAVAAILVFFFSQAYIKKIQKVNSSHHTKEESSVVSRNKVSAEIGGIYLENPPEEQTETTDETTETTDAEPDSDEQIYVVNENNELVPLEPQITVPKSILESYNEGTTTKKKFSMLKNPEDETTETSTITDE